MKLFQIVRKDFARLGISCNQSHCNRKSAITFSIYSLSSTMGILFLIFDANDFLEYTMNIFVTSTLVAIWIAFCVFLFEKEEIFKAIDDVEVFVNKREY